jgi:hypothetical protein
MMYCMRSMCRQYSRTSRVEVDGGVASRDFVHLYDRPFSTMNPEWAWSSTTRTRRMNR